MKPSLESDSSLPPVWVVGFAGHRHLQEPGKVAGSIREVLESLRHEIIGDLMAYSSVAIGADMLFAETCISLDIPWTAVLPLPENDFKNDFNQSDWQAISALLKRAAHVISLPATTDRDLAYLECGLSTVEEADVMLAVWDGESSRGPGGTADVVAHARTMGKPLIVVEPGTLRIERERFSPELFLDGEMSYLNGVPSYEPCESVSQPEERVRCFFQKVDRHASGIAPRVRGLIGASVLMNAVAAILTTATITLAFTSKVVDVLMFLLVAAATVSVALLKRKGAHRKWVRCRVAAEICRSALATWKLGDVSIPFWFTQLDGFSRLAKSIRLLHLSEKKIPSLTLNDYRREYLRLRVDEQLTYFRRHRYKLIVAAAILSGCFWTFSAAGIGRTILSTFFLKQRAGTLYWEAVHSFLPIALPLAAGSALSLTSIFDLNRQLARAKVMEAVLITIRDRIEKCENLTSLRHTIEHAENVFAGELFEWFTLSKHPRFS